MDKTVSHGTLVCIMHRFETVWKTRFYLSVDICAHTEYSDLGWAFEMWDYISDRCKKFSGFPWCMHNKLCGRSPQYAPPRASGDTIYLMHVYGSVTCGMLMLAWLEQPTKAAWWPWPLAFWPWKWCQSHVTWATSLPILVFLGLSVLDLGLMYATDRRRQTSDAHHRLMPHTRRGGA